jgi:hypothetical protein
VPTNLSAVPNIRLQNVQTTLLLQHRDIDITLHPGGIYMQAETALSNSLSRSANDNSKIEAAHEVRANIYGRYGHEGAVALKPRDTLS